jgi:TetR/AcrR family transcriptional regulator, regulator of autoinduction and epiphytic fitness
MAFKMLRYPPAMARNKRDIDAQTKREAIVTHAHELFMAHGFDDTSMAMISRAAAIAPNTIYWYFAGKDEVLLAALDRLIAGLALEYNTKHFRSPLQRLTWVFNQFDAHHKLIQAVHARLDQSPALRAWHDHYHQALEALLTEQMVKEGKARDRAQLMATVGTFVIEGLLSHPHSQAQRKAILAWLAGEAPSSQPG